MQAEPITLKDCFPVNKHYTDFSLKLFSSLSGFRIESIRMHPVTISFGQDSEIPSIKTVEAIITICQLSDGLLSYLHALPKYGIQEELIDTYPSICEDIDIRFSIRPDGKGYYTPTWIRCYSRGKAFTPQGDRIDWDFLENKASKWTHRKSHRWIIPDLDFEKATSTHEGNVEAAKKMFSVWFNFGAFRSDDTVY